MDQLLNDIHWSFLLNNRGSISKFCEPVLSNYFQLILSKTYGSDLSKASGSVLSNICESLFE